MNCCLSNEIHGGEIREERIDDSGMGEWILIGELDKGTRRGWPKCGLPRVSKLYYKTMLEWLSEGGGGGG